MLSEKDQATLDKLAEECSKAHPENIGAAANAMKAKIQDNPRLYKEVADLLIIEACKERIRRRKTARNRKIWTTSERVVTDPSARARRALVTARTFRLMDYTLAGGKKIGEATKAELIYNAEMRNRQGTKMIQTALWLNLIASDMQENERVSDRYDERDLREFQRVVLTYGSAAVDGASTSPGNGADHDRPDATVFN